MKLTPGRRLAFFPIPIFVVSMAVIYFTVAPTLFFEPAWLLPITNTLFVTVMSFLVAYVAMRNYRATGQIQILLLGCGLLSVGTGAVVAAAVRGVPIAGVNLNVTIYNTAALMGGAFHFAAAFLLLAGLSSEVKPRQKTWWQTFSYTAIAVLVVLFTAAVYKGMVPPFFVQGVGATALRQAVLGTADILFAFSSLIFMGWYLRKRDVFLYWYSLALGLTAIGLAGFLMERAIGSPLGWASRSSIYLGGIYFLFAISAGIKNAHSQGDTFDHVIAAALSPTEEQFLRTIYDNLTEGLYVCDRAGRTILVNEAVRKLFRDNGETVPHRMSDMQAAMELFELNGRAIPLSGRPGARILRGERVHGMEVRMRFKATGKELILSYNGAPVRDRNGDVTMAVFTAEDITERKRAEDALRQWNEQLEQRVAERTSELANACDKVLAERQRFLDVLETLPVIVSLLQPDHRVVWVNQAYRSALSDNAGRLCYESQFGFDKPCAECQAFLPLQTGRQHNWEWTLPNGRTFDIHNYPFVDTDGSPLILEMDIDITERRLAEAELEKHRQHLEELVEKRTGQLEAAHARLQALMKALPVGVSFSDDATCQRITGNPAVLAQFEVTPEDNLSPSAPDETAPGRQVQFFRDGRKISDAELPLQRAVAENREIPPMELEVCLANGRRWIADASGAPIRDQQGNVVGGVVVTVDITDRKQAEQALLRSEKLALVGRLAASIAHEINNPLAAVVNTVFLAQSSADDPQAVRQYLAMAEDELKRVSHITRQALGFYRESSAPTSVSVGSILDSAVDLLRGKVKLKGAAIEKQYEKDPQVRAVPGELRQVFSNLLANSLDAIGQGGRIRLRLSLSTCAGQSRVRVTVADNGMGINSATLPRIFEPLFTTKQITGSGLGLWVSKQLVDKHHGSIHVRSTTHGKWRGTTFLVVLPLR